MRMTRAEYRCMSSSLTVSRQVVPHSVPLDAEKPEMITTVLKSESYLFTQREIWALQCILSLPCKSALPCHLRSSSSQMNRTTCSPACSSDGRAKSTLTRLCCLPTQPS